MNQIGRLFPLGKQRIDVPLCPCQIEGQRRIDGPGLRGLTKLSKQRFGLLHVQHGYRGLAVCAGGPCRQINGRSAVGTIHNLDLVPEFLELLLRQRPNKVLLPKEFEEADQAAMVAGTSEITEPDISLHVLRLPQWHGASRAQCICELRGAGSGALSNDLQQSKRRRWGKLETLIFVETDSLTLNAQIDGDLPALMAVECHRCHFCGAIRAVHAADDKTRSEKNGDGTALEVGEEGNLKMDDWEISGCKLQNRKLDEPTGRMPVQFTIL